MAVLDEAVDVEVVDMLCKHQLDEAVDVAAGAIDEKRHLSSLLEPALEHEVVFALVCAVLLDLGDQSLIVRKMLADGGEHLVQRRVTAMLIVDVDGRNDVEPPASEPRQHHRTLVPAVRGVNAGWTSALQPLSDVTEQTSFSCIAACHI